MYHLYLFFHLALVAIPKGWDRKTELCILLKVMRQPIQGFALAIQA